MITYSTRLIESKLTPMPKSMMFKYPKFSINVHVSFEAPNGDGGNSTGFCLKAPNGDGGNSTGFCFKAPNSDGSATGFCMRGIVLGLFGVV